MSVKAAKAVQFINSFSESGHIRARWIIHKKTFTLLDSLWTQTASFYCKVGHFNFGVHRD